METNTAQNLQTQIDQAKEAVHQSQLGSTQAQQAVDAVKQIVKAGTNQTGHALNEQLWTPDFAYKVGISVLVFGIVITSMMSLLVMAGGKNAEETQRLFALPLIVIAAVFLVVIGYSQDQIAPVIGLLGTIAGYLLGAQKNNQTSSPGAAAGGSPGAATAKVGT